MITLTIPRSATIAQATEIVLAVESAGADINYGTTLGVSATGNDGKAAVELYRRVESILLKSA